MRHERKSVGKAFGKGFLSPKKRPKKETVPSVLWIRYSLKVTSGIPAATLLPAKDDANIYHEGQSPRVVRQAVRAFTALIW